MIIYNFSEFFLEIGYNVIIYVQLNILCYLQLIFIII